MSKSNTGFIRRRNRVRTKIRACAADRPRLSVFKSNRHIYAQIIDDVQGVTLVAASTLDEGIRQENKSHCNKACAEKVGILVGQRAKEKGIEKVVFDRGGYSYQGVVASLAEAARKAELSF